MNLVLYHIVSVIWFLAEFLFCVDSLVTGFSRFDLIELYEALWEASFFSRKIRECGPCSGDFAAAVEGFPAWWSKMLLMLPIISCVRLFVSLSHGASALWQVILFSDILTPLSGMNIPFDIVKGKGPVIFNPLSSAEDVNEVREFVPAESVPYVGEALTILREEVYPYVSLFNFDFAHLLDVTLH